MTEELKPLSAAERKRNVQRVRDAEERLSTAETALLTAGTQVASVYRELREVRGELRKAMQLDPLGPGAPIFREGGDD